MRHLTYVILTFVIGAILVTSTMSAAVSSGFQRFGVEDTRVLDIVNLSSLIALVAGATTFGVLVRNRKALSFTDEVIGELTKVTWPTREETVRASVTVVVVTAFTATLLASYDYIWKNLADLFLFTDG